MHADLSVTLVRFVNGTPLLLNTIREDRSIDDPLKRFLYSRTRFSYDGFFEAIQKFDRFDVTRRMSSNSLMENLPLWSRTIVSHFDREVAKRLGLPLLTASIATLQLIFFVLGIAIVGPEHLLGAFALIPGNVLGKLYVRTTNIHTNKQFIFMFRHSRRG